MPRKKLDQDASVAGSQSKPNLKGKADESLPLNLTRLQRDSLIHCTRIKKKIKDRIQAAAAGTQVIAVTRKELEYLWGEIATASVFAPNPDKKRLVTVMGKVTDLLEASADEALPEDRSSAIRKAPPSDGNAIYQFKITLLEIQPAIWRRIQVPECTLAELHLHIQTAFGWWNYHLHQFEIDGDRYGPRFDDDMGLELDTHDEAEVGAARSTPKPSTPRKRRGRCGRYGD